jgi:2',3'-cyclic-nucleotide 2'-phosphodiesterase (5'-nucleotidase family)
VAEEVPGIDAILIGHAHTEIAQRFVTNKATGKRVLLTEPLFWGKRLSLMEFDLAWTSGRGRPVGRRIVGLAYDGVAVTPDQAFAVAVNNYRQSGGGNFPHIASAPVLHNRQLEIRQLIIEWVLAHGEIDPATFHRTDWRLVVNGTPVVVG